LRMGGGVVGGMLAMIARRISQNHPLHQSSHRLEIFQKVIKHIASLSLGGPIFPLFLSSLKKDFSF
jgi:hypothetical protein